MGGPNSVFNQAKQNFVHNSNADANVPDLTPPPPPPDPNGNAAAAMHDQEIKQAQRQGRASTVLTGGAGLLDTPNTASRTLLGA